MTGYAIFNINVNNPENYKEYVEKVKPIAEKYGGEYLVRSGFPYRYCSTKTVEYHLINSIGSNL